MCLSIFECDVVCVCVCVFCCLSQRIFECDVVCVCERERERGGIFECDVVCVCVLECVRV